MILLALAAMAAQALTVPTAAPPPVTATPVTGAPTTAPPSDTTQVQGSGPVSSSGLGATGFLTAESLQAKCQENSAAMVSYCYAYIAGVHDTIRAYETWLNMREFCRPVRVSQSELRRAFLDYLTANPRASSGEAASVVVIALRTKFACDTAQPVTPAAP